MRGGAGKAAGPTEGVVGVKIRTTVEHLIQAGERPIEDVIRDIEELAGHLRHHQETGHTKAAVVPYSTLPGSSVNGSARVTVTHEEGEPKTADAAPAPEAPAEAAAE